MGPLQGSINQSLGTLATIAGLSKAGGKLKDIEQKIATPEERAKAQAEANTIQQRADWEQELQGVNKQLDNISKINFKEELENLRGNLYVRDKHGIIQEDTDGKPMLTQEADKFFTKANLNFEDFNNLQARQRDLVSKLNKQSEYEKSLEESTKMINKQAYVQNMKVAFENADVILTKNLIQKADIKNMYQNLKTGDKSNYKMLTVDEILKGKGGTENG